MKDLFAGYFRYSDDEYTEIWDKAIFVVDTNVLLNFFKYSTKDTTSSFFDILKKLKEDGRLYIPHHVALEFFFNYEDIMDSQREGINQLVNNLLQLEKEANDIFNRFSSSNPYIKNDNFKFILHEIVEINKKIELQREEEIKSLPDVQELKNELLGLMEGIIGEPYNQIKINEIEREGKERYKHETPPGWKDQNDKQKLSFRTYGGIRYQQLFGDLIIWNQMIDKMKDEDEDTKSIIFITEEKKVDWWDKDGSGNIKRPQPHLIQEFLEKTKQKFYMYRIDTFVKYAMQYLGAEVTDEQMHNLTTQVENIRKTEEVNENKVKFSKSRSLNSIFDYLNDIEREIFYEMIEESNDLELDSSTANSKYNQAMKWAIRNALPKVEKEYHDLVNIVKNIDEDKGYLVQQFYFSLPEDIDKRALILVDEILKIKKDLNIYR